MKISSEIMQKIEINVFDMMADDFQELKRFYHHDKKSFVKLVDDYIIKIKKKEDIDRFLYFFEGLKNEIAEVAPFLVNNINKIFVLLIKNNYYKQIAEYSFILDNCANVKVLQLLDDFVRGKNAFKLLTSMEIYKIKKLIFTLSNKFKRDDIAYKIQVELENTDMNWLDHIEK
jgi:hypothetical protein